MSNNSDFSGISDKNIGSAQFDSNNNAQNMATTPKDINMDSPNANHPHQENGNNIPGPSVNPGMQSSEAAPDAQESKEASTGQKPKAQKIKLDSTAHAELIKKVELMFAANLPLNEITKQCEISTKQALKILMALKEEHRIAEYKPPYTIVPANTTIARIFSRFAATFKEAMLIANVDGSVTVKPIKAE